jgi:hypothetical protein
MKLRLCALLLALGAVGCSGTTGGNLIQIPFQAGGIARDATVPFNIPTTGQGWNVTLTAAQVVLGPLYFNVSAAQQNVVRGASGVVIMQVTRLFIVDMLDPTLHVVSGGANGETGTAVSVEVDFFTAANSYNQDIDGGLPAPLAENGQEGTAYLAGTASKEGVTVPFAGRIQITSALVTAITPIDLLSSVPGALTNLTFTKTSGPLQLRVDPTRWFDQTNFCSLVTTPVKPAAMDGGVGADAGAADGGTAPGAAPVGLCAPTPGTTYSWSDTNPFNSSVLGGMKGSVGVYQFSLGQ